MVETDKRGDLRRQRAISMMRRLRLVLAAGAALLALGAVARAHPHVWVMIKSEVMFAPDGTLTGVRHAWTFDEMFSTFATQGLDKDNDGKLSRDELASLAEVNVTSLKEFDFFTYAKFGGKKAAFKQPVDYYLDHDKGELTLHFTLPLDKPVKPQAAEFEIYDPTLFVGFSFAEKDPAVMARAPAACKLTVARPADATSLQTKPLGESFFNQLDATSGYAAQFANKIAVTCP